MINENDNNGGSGYAIQFKRYSRSFRRITKFFFYAGCFFISICMTKSASAGPQWATLPIDLVYDGADVAYGQYIVLHVHKVAGSTANSKIHLTPDTKVRIVRGTRLNDAFNYATTNCIEIYGYNSHVWHLAQPSGDRITIDFQPDKGTMEWQPVKDHVVPVGTPLMIIFENVEDLKHIKKGWDGNGVLRLPPSAAHEYLAHAIEVRVPPPGDLTLPEPPPSNTHVIKDIAYRREVAMCFRLETERQEQVVKLIPSFVDKETYLATASSQESKCGAGD